MSDAEKVAQRLLEAPMIWAKDIHAAAELLKKQAARIAALESAEKENGELLTALAECRDAFPVPAVGGELEGHWVSAMANPDEVPAYVKACIESAEKEAAPVACWAAYNGVCLEAFFKTEHAAKSYAADMQKSHDLSGSLAAFIVKPLYAAPASKDAIRREALEEAAIQWDGCFYEGVAERIDICAAIRALSQKETGEC